jgi:hypothetical protein
MLTKIAGRPLVTPSNKTITAVYGQPLTLTMEFCANPPYNKVFWIAKNKVYIPGDADKTVIAYGITVSILVRKLKPFYRPPLNCPLKSLACTCIFFTIIKIFLYFRLSDIN